MEPHHHGFESWQEILDTLEHGGMTDYEEYPEVYFAWCIAKEKNEFALIDDLLSENPWILFEAKKRVRECPFFQPKREELSMIQGQFSLGYANAQGKQAGLDESDFMRGLFVFGETGAGKSYPVLRIISQALSMPKKPKVY